MTLFNVSFDDVNKMAVEKFNSVLNWRIKYEEEKQKYMKEEINNQKSKANSKKSTMSKLKDTYK